MAAVEKQFKMSDKITMDEELQLGTPSLFGSCRLNVALMCLLGSLVSYLTTINLGMVIVCINQHPTSASHRSNQTILYATGDVEGVIVWDKRAQGMLLSALYFGVVGTELTSSWLCNKYGRFKIHTIAGIGVLGLSNLLSSVVIENAGIPYFFALRVIKGISMSLCVSALFPLLTTWTTTKERGFLLGLAFAGFGIGNSITYPLSSLLCQYGGWKSIFYAAGASGLVWSLAAYYIIYDNPMKHPRISYEEKQYLLSHHQIQTKEMKTRVLIPWSKIARSIPVWSVVVCNFFFFAVVKGTVVNLPLYIRDVLNFTVTENGIFSALPAVLALLIHLIMGPLFDFARAKNVLSVTTLRKVFHGIGTFLPAVLMLAVSRLHPDQHKYIIISLISVGHCFSEVAIMGGFTYSNADLAPDFVAILQGITNTIGFTTGFIIPLVVANLTTEGTHEEWMQVFTIFGGLYIASGLAYVLGGSAELQSWGKVTLTHITHSTDASEIQSD